MGYDFDLGVHKEVRYDLGGTQVLKCLETVP